MPMADPAIADYDAKQEEIRKVMAGLVSVWLAWFVKPRG